MTGFDSVDSFTGMPHDQRMPLVEKIQGDHHQVGVVESIEDATGKGAAMSVTCTSYIVGRH
jgi:hypothetical protein